MPITNGHIEYERRVKTGDFEHKQSKAVVHFAVEGDEFDEIMELASALATRHVFDALRATPRLGQKHDPVDTAPAPVSTPAPVVAVPGGINGADVVPDVGPQVTNLKAAKRAVKKQAVIIDAVPDAEIIEDPTVAVPATVVSSPDSVIVPDVGIVDDFTAQAPTLSDAELGQALSRINAKLKDPPRIRGLIGEYVTSGSSYTMIPAVRRGEFVSRLEALA